MRKSNLLASLLLAAPLAAGASSPIEGVTFQSSPFEACQDATMISSKDFKQNEAFWKQAIGECGIDVQILPDTGFFNTMVGKLGGAEDSTRAMEFLKRVGVRTSKYIELNNELTDHLLHCAAKDKAWFDEKLANAKNEAEKNFYDFSDCESVVKKMRDSAQEVGVRARTLLGVIKNTGSRWDSFKDGVKYWTGTQMPIESVAMSPSEKAEAEKIMARDEAEVQQKFAEAIKKNEERLKSNRERMKTDFMVNEYDGVESWFQGWYRETSGGKSPKTRTANPYYEMATLPIRNEILAKHRDEFSSLLQQVPILGYLAPSKDPESFLKNGPTHEDIVAAAKMVLQNGEETKAAVAKILADGSRAERMVMGRGQSAKVKVSEEQRAKAMLELMQYGPVVQEILREDPASCQTATGLANSIMNTELRNNVALMVGMIGTAGAAAVVGPVVLAGTAAASIATPAILATGVGVGFGAKFTYDDYNKFYNARRAAFSAVETVEQGKAVGSVKDFEEARDNFVFAMALSPADLVGSGVFLKTAAAGAAIGAVLTKPAARVALTSALKKKGISDLEIQRLLKNIQSPDPAVAQAAARKIITETGMDENQIKFIRAAASKGLILEQNPEAMRAVMKEVKDGKVYNRALKILESVNSAKINAGNRDQALKAAIAGAEFGVTDPQRLAAIITDWDEGLDGLAKTYEIAAKKLNEPSIRGLASVEARQNAAFSSALDDLRASNPELKSMPEKQWAEMKENMMVCPLKPGK